MQEVFKIKNTFVLYVASSADNILYEHSILNIKHLTFFHLVHNYAHRLIYSHIPPLSDIARSLKAMLALMISLENNDSTEVFVSCKHAFSHCKLTRYL